MLYLRVRYLVRLRPFPQPAQFISAINPCVGK